MQNYHLIVILGLSSFFNFLTNRLYYEELAQF